MYIPLGYAQVNLMWTGTAVPLGAQTTFAVKSPSGATPADVFEQVNTSIEDAALTASLSNEVGITSILVKLGPNSIGASGEFGTSHTGEVGAQTVPPQVALLARKFTQAGGKSGSGRWFLPGLIESAVSGAGIISQTFMGDYFTQHLEFLTSLSVSEFPMYLLHGGEGGLLGPLEVTSLVPQQKVATQRRRLR